MDFPIYRKYKGIDVWFKIYNTDCFLEVKKVGKRTISSEIKAILYPEKQFIMDMINCYEDRWEEADEVAFKTFLNQ